MRLVKCSACCVAAVVVVGLTCASALAAVSASTFAGVSNPADGSARSDPSMYALFDQQTTTNALLGSPLNINVDQSFTGIDNSGDARTMRYQVAGRAEAQYQHLRNSVTMSVDNFFYRPEANAAYHDPATNTTNTEGVPDTFGAGTTTRSAERLIYGGTALSYTSRYFLLLEGRFEGDGGYAVVTIQHGFNVAEHFYFLNLTGDVQVPIVSSAYVNGPNQTFAITLQVGVLGGRLDYLEDGESHFGSAEFGNTLSLVGVEARDTLGNLLEPGSLVGESSGLTYPIIVPEPTSLGAVVALAGTLMLRFRARTT
jgi:hypothetical protein